MGPGSSVSPTLKQATYEVRMTTSQISPEFESDRFNCRYCRALSAHYWVDIDPSDNDGNEIILLREKDDELVFPTYENLIPDSSKCKTFDLNTSSRHALNNNYADCIRKMAHSTALDLDLFKKACSIFRFIGTAKARIVEGKAFAPIIIEGEKFLALVMPLRKID